MKKNEIAFEEKRQSEVRGCPRCDLEISNPFVELCPRCFTKLSRLELECTGCVHRILCPAVPSQR